MKRAICLYLQVHQPYRVRPYNIVEAGKDHNYFHNPNPNDLTCNEAVLHKVAHKSYLPANALLYRLLEEHPNFSFSLSITGTVIEQMRDYAPEVLESFQRLVATGRVEVLAETYYHSLAFFYSQPEFERQVKLHERLMKDTFGVKPKTFRNTELAYNNLLAHWADSKGYKAILAEGWDPVLEWRSPNYLYRPTYTRRLGLLLKNYRLSDDIAFRFSDRDWGDWPLTAEKFVHWLDELDQDQEVVNLFMDYETLGEHQWSDSGIFDFLEDMPRRFLATKGHTFLNPAQAVRKLKPRDYIDVPDTITWADTERDLSAWLGNAMQQQAIRALYDMEEEVLNTRDIGIIGDWRRLSTSDHFYYMCTKWFNDGDIHAYFSPYESPYDAFIFYMNALRDLRVRVDRVGSKKTGRGRKRKAADTQ